VVENHHRTVPEIRYIQLCPAGHTIVSLAGAAERRRGTKGDRTMKTKCNFTIVLMAVLTIAAISTAAWAQTGPQPKSQECGLIGTWVGGAGSSMVWLGVHTAGSKDAKNGEMLMNWVKVSNSLGGAPGFHLTPGHGVWEQIDKGEDKGKYKYTWYAYGIEDSSGVVGYSVRVSGVAMNTDCDNVSIHYKYEMFAGFVGPQEMSNVDPSGYSFIEGDAAETRLPLAQVTPTP
jgi:hypothetical protein